LNSNNIYSKTIFHEQSSTSKDKNQIWTHPDMIGISFLYLQNNASKVFQKAIKNVDTFKLYSYELKKEIYNDSDLKQAYFQAISNSSWANYGYLVALEINDNINEEMNRLNQSFGIGIIKLNANPFTSKVLYPAKYHELDFKTIDKLCINNKEFENFIFQIEKLITADEKYIEATKQELEKFCDDYFTSDSEIEKYCKDKHIPWEEE
jgi:uncharacterized protein